MHFGIWSQIIKNILVSKRRFDCGKIKDANYRLPSDKLILVSVEYTILLKEYNNNSYTLRSFESNYNKCASVQTV